MPPVTSRVTVLSRGLKVAIRRYLPRSISNISGIPFIASDPVSSILPLRDGTGSEKIWRTPNQRCEEIRSKRQRKSLIEQTGAETLLASERKLSSSSEVIIGTRRRRRKTQHRLILLHLSGGREREREWQFCPGKVRWAGVEAKSLVTKKLRGETRRALS